MRRGGCLGWVVFLTLAVVLFSVFRIVSDAFGGNQARMVEEPQPYVAQEATVIVTGSEGGPYWLRVFDDAGNMGFTKRDILGDSATEYPVDLDRIKPNDPDSNFWNSVTAEVGKSEDWEGSLSVLLKVDGKFVDCQGTIDENTDEYPRDYGSGTASSGAFITYELGVEPDGSSACRTHLWFN